MASLRRNADCGMPVESAFQEKAGYMEDELRAVQDGAEDTEERVLVSHTEVCKR